METAGPDTARDATDRFAYGELMQFRVLGPVEVIDDSIRLGLGGLKQRTVLAILIANAGVTVSTDRLIEATWRGDAPEGARHTIQTYVSNLRGVLGDAIVRDGPGYRLDADRSAIDALWFEDDVLTATTMQEDPEAVGDGCAVPWRYGAGIRTTMWTQAPISIRRSPASRGCAWRLWRRGSTQTWKGVTTGRCSVSWMH